MGHLGVFPRPAPVASRVLDDSRSCLTADTRCSVISDVTRNWRQRITQNRVFRSLFRHSYPDDPRTRALVVFSNVFLHLHPIKIRKASLRITYTFCLGGLSFFLFLLLTVTGVLLMFYYRPAVEHAYADMKDLETVVGFGMMLRNIHRYSAHGMVITVFLHMIRVFYTGAYKPPREFNWVVGVVLFTLTLLLSFTGYLLPWDQLAFWAITVGTNMVGSAPGFGEQVRFMLIGGYEVGENALIRFYVLHVIGLPLLLAVFMAVHFWRIRKDGGIAGPL
jgi:quinol---cytochrome c reductase cytochrome b subunit, bacillus type